MHDLRELYQEVIIDHNRNPRNHHTLEACSHHAAGFNPLCGDEVTLYLQVDNDIITDISFKGKGCAISMASASIMTETLKGKSIKDAHALFHDFHSMLTEEALPSEGLGKLSVLAGVKEYPTRIKCATLIWHTLVAALKQSKAIASTE